MFDFSAPSRSLAAAALALCAAISARSDAQRVNAQRVNAHSLNAQPAYDTIVVEPILPVTALQCQHLDVIETCDERGRFVYEDPRLHVGGWLQQGFTWNPSNPSNRQNAPVLFNDRANDYQLNQLYFYLAREAVIDGTWNWGGRVDVNLGTDSRFVTVPGLEEHHDRTAKWNGEGKQYGIAVPQAYAELATPIGPLGSSLRVGHFYALGGYETFAAPENFFYSHAYTYLYGEPFTFTGAMLLAPLNDSMALGIAATSGWDVWDSSANEWGLRVGWMTKSADRRTTLAVTLHSGNDFTGITTGSGPMDDSRHWASLVFKHELLPRAWYVFQADYGYQDSAVVVLNQTTNRLDFEAARWWGVNQYLTAELTDTWSAGLRVEWFRDEDNARVAVPVRFNPAGPTFTGQDYVGVTAGFNWEPHSNIRFRQEVRWDWSNVASNPAVPGGQAGVRPFNDRTSRDQVTVAVDMVLLF